MRTLSPSASVLALAALLLATSVVATATSQAPAPPTPMSDDELAKVGEQLTTKVCIECHPMDDIVASRRTPRDWKDVITQMTIKGAIATPVQLVTVRDYLTRFHGVVRVNTAVATDFTAVLGLPAKQADAVVEYRAKNGKFADADALLKVPGIDRERVEADPDALYFD